METIKERLAEAMHRRFLKAVTLIEKCKEYEKQYGAKITRSDISFYLSGRSKPKSNKLTILARALNVNPEWLLGADVPMEYDSNITQNNINNSGDNILTVNSDVKVSKNGKELTEIQQEIVNVCDDLTIRSQVKVLNYAYDLRDEEKKAN